jgi:hypothetical protein
MAEPFNEIRAAIPPRVAVGSRLEGLRPMKHRVPRRHERTEAKRNAEVSRPVRRRDCRLSHEIGIERLEVGLARLDEGRIGEGGKEMAPVASHSLAHRALEGHVGPLADPCCFVGRDVGRVDCAEGRGDGPAARERHAARRRMAMDAPAETRRARPRSMFAADHVAGSGRATGAITPRTGRLARPSDPSAPNVAASSGPATAVASFACLSEQQAKGTRLPPPRQIQPRASL